ncbi:LEM domain-containing protein 1 isoform 4-T4 [Anomaloglossus baeobatrachus]|uniref:LEM domain-containing protein 1 isoform X4 n=1 Tax=Anomaloglossus baeobatrachus TaxID=238106 RepID=UPI003F4FAAFF
MPTRTGNLSQYSKDQLKNLLISHNVPLPQSDQRKAVYMQLYLKHILPKDKEAADFSSDDEDTWSENDLQPVGDQEEKTSDKMDLKSLSDSELKEQLRKHGVNPGPILPTTRGIYERKLQQLLEEKQVKENGGGHEDQYSDSEDEGVQVKNLSDMRCELNGDGGDKTLGHDNYSQKNQDDASPDDFSDLLSQSALGMSATRRKPIKGAAGRPIQFRYDDIVARARMLEQNKETVTEGKPKRLVSVRLQIVIFLLVAFVALVYITMESSPENPFNTVTEDLAEVQQP